jgi:hypothetical protein
MWGQGTPCPHIRHASNFFEHRFLPRVAKRQFRAKFCAHKISLMAPQKSFHRRRQAIHFFSGAALLGAVTLASTTRAETSPATVRLPRLNADHQNRITARENADSILWQNARLTPATKETTATPQQIQQNVRAIIIADPTLSRAYGWRGLLRGDSQQTWKLTESSVGEMRLQIGRQSLPVMQLSGISGARAAAGLSGNSFGFYSTKPLRALNQNLQGADELLGEKVSHDATDLNWVTLRPWSTPGATLDIVYLQGQNDLNPNSILKAENQLRRGSMAGAKLAFALPARWKLNGEWMNSRMEGAGDSGGNDDALVFALAGPISHPWGKTGVRFSYRAVGENFSSFTGAPTDAGIVTKTLALVQPFKSGDLSGSLGVNWSERAAIAETGSTPSTPTDTALMATSNLKWQATSDLALTAAHDAGNRFTTQAPLSDLLLPQTIERENSSSRVGVDWKLTKRFSLSATGGLTRYDEETADERLLRKLGNRDEHYSLNLKNKTVGAQWNIGYERRIALDLEGDAGALADTLSLGAQTKITSWLKFGGAYRLAQTENLSSGLVSPRSDFAANTTLSLQELGELQLRYTQALSTPEAGVRLGAPAGARGYGVRYVLGSSREGLGLSLDYARQETGGPAAQEQWKIGLTYR